jgi:hypothetical protein
MNTPDDFSQYHAELLDGIYDCVDRIVLNAFFPLGQTGGGMRRNHRPSAGLKNSQDSDNMLAFVVRLAPIAQKAAELSLAVRAHSLRFDLLRLDRSSSGVFNVTW